MGPRFRRLLLLCSSISIVFFFSLLCGCGGSSHSSTNNGSNNPGASGSGSGSAGSSNTGSGGSGSTSTGSSNSVAYAYTSNGTSIVAYAVNGDGSLTAVSGSPYAVSTQLQQPTTQGELVTNGANLYALAAGGTNIDIMAINKANGSLSQAATTSALIGDPNTGDLASSLSLDSTGSSLYAMVGLSDLDSGVNVFSTSGGLSQVQFLMAGAIAPPPLVFSANNQYAYTPLCTARVEGVFGFARGANGALTNLSLSNVPSSISSAGTNYCPIAVAASAAGYLAIVWTPFQYGSSVAVGNQTYVGIYKINSDGSLSLVTNSNVTTASTSNLALNFDPAGSYLAVVGNGGVQTFKLNSDGTLTAVSQPVDAGVSFSSVAWDKSNHVFATSSSQIYVFLSNGGSLTPAAGSPYSGGSALAVLPLQ